MTEIGVGRYGDMLRRFLGMRGTSLTPGRDLLPDLNAAFVLENDRPEWSFLKGERRFVGAHAIDAALLEFAELIIINPINSGVVSVITSISLVSARLTLRGQVRVGGLARFATTGVMRPSDQRVEGGIATSLNGLSVAPLDGVIVSETRAPVDTTTIFPGLVMVVPPNSFFKIVDSTANAFLIVSIIGYERALEAYER